MPKIVVQYRYPYTPEAVRRLADRLPQIVAEALTCENPEGSLTPSDIEIDFGVMGSNLRTRYNLHIEVEANYYPERKANLPERVQLIKKKILSILKTDPGAGKLDSFKAWIWVKLFIAGWEEI